MYRELTMFALSNFTMLFFITAIYTINLTVATVAVTRDASDKSWKPLPSTFPQSLHSTPMTYTGDQPSSDHVQNFSWRSWEENFSDKASSKPTTSAQSKTSDVELSTSRSLLFIANEQDMDIIKTIEKKEHSTASAALPRPEVATNETLTLMMNVLSNSSNLRDADFKNSSSSATESHHGIFHVDSVTPKSDHNYSCVDRNTTKIFSSTSNLTDVSDFNTSTKCSSSGSENLESLAANFSGGAGVPGTGGPMRKPPAPNLIMAGIMVVTSVVICVVNSLTLAAIRRSKALHTNADMYIASLSAAGFFEGIFTLTKALQVLPAIGRYINNIQHVCHVFRMAGVTTGTASLLSLAGVSIDRCICISRPLHYRSIQDQMTRIFISCIWAFSILYGCVPFFSDLAKCSDVVKNNIPEYRYSICAMFFAVSILIVCCYIQIARAYVEGRKNMERYRAPAPPGGTTTTSFIVKDESPMVSDVFPSTHITPDLPVDSKATLSNESSNTLPVADVNCPHYIMPSTSARGVQGDHCKECDQHVLGTNELQKVNDVNSEKQRYERSRSNHRNFRNTKKSEEAFVCSDARCDGKIPKQQSENSPVGDTCTETGRPSRKQKSNNKRARAGTGFSRQGLHLMKTIMVTITFYFICFTPARIFIGIIEEVQLSDMVMSLAIYLTNFNAVSNFLIYVIFNPRYRTSIANVISHPCSC